MTRKKKADLPQITKATASFELVIDGQTVKRSIELHHDGWVVITAPEDKDRGERTWALCGPDDIMSIDEAVKVAFEDVVTSYSQKLTPVPVALRKAAEPHEEDDDEPEDDEPSGPFGGIAGLARKR